MILHRFAPLVLAALLACSPTWANTDDALPMAPAAAAEAPLFSADYGHGLRIEGSEAFVARMVPILDGLAQLPSGAKVLEGLGESGKQTVLREFSDGYPMTGVLDETYLRDGFLAEVGGTGYGTDALVSWPERFQLEGFNDPIALGHELIHALDLHRGKWTLEQRAQGSHLVSVDELRAIGIDGFEGEEITENVMRREWNELHPEARVPTKRISYAAEFAPEHEHDHGGAAEGATDVIEEELGANQ